MFAKGTTPGELGRYDAAAVYRPTRISASDRKKLSQAKDRIGGKHKTLGVRDRHSSENLPESERKLAVSQLTNIGRKRAVGNPDHRSLRTSDIHREALLDELEALRGRTEEIERLLDSGGSQGAWGGGVLTTVVDGLPEALYFNPDSYSGAHHAAFPSRLVLDIIRACTTESGSAESGSAGEGDSGSVVLDPFMGSGTTAQAARSLGRQCVGLDLDRRNLALVENRLSQEVLF